MEKGVVSQLVPSLTLPSGKVMVMGSRGWAESCRMVQSALLYSRMHPSTFVEATRVHLVRKKAQTD